MLIRMPVEGGTCPRNRLCRDISEGIKLQLSGGRCPEEPLAWVMGINGDTFGEIRVAGVKSRLFTLCATIGVLPSEPMEPGSAQIGRRLD